MHYLIALISAALLSLSAPLVQAGVAPSSNADHMSQSGAKISKKPAQEQQPQSEQQPQQQQQSQPAEENKTEKK